jgi:acylphosphatase
LDYVFIGSGRECRAGIHGLGAHAAGGIRLGVDVDDEDPASRQTEGVSKGGGGSRLADAAFLIGDCEDAGHGLSLGNALYVVPGQGQQKTLGGSFLRGYNLWRGRSTWNTALLGGRCMKIRTHVYYSGQVQGVGFRYSVERFARGQAVTGFVRNLRDGRVELVVEGEQADVGRLLDGIDRIMRGYIHNRLIKEEPPTGEFSGFEVAFGAV